MASETINVGSGTDNAAMMMAAMAGRGGDGLFGAGGGGLIGGLILGSLLRNNGNLFGGDGAGAVAGATLRNPPEQNQANMDLMQAIGAVEESKLLPESLLRRPDLNTGVAFDSFDLFVETLTGKDTLYCNAVVAASLK